MILERKYTIGIRDVGLSNLITNRGILNLLEDIACLHSDMAGYGVNQIPQTHLSWVLLHWKVSILKRVTYGDTITIKTWARCANKFFTLRDFQVLDEQGNLVCIATSKWTLINTETSGINRITSDIIDCYHPEEKSVFNESDIVKLKEPQLPEFPNYTFTVQRRDIDVNNHMHNLYYLDYSYEALPQEVYEKPESNQFEIMYKSGAKLGNEVNCFYTIQDDNQYVVMKSAKENQLHAIIKLY